TILSSSDVMTIHNAYSVSLHDALPISIQAGSRMVAPTSDFRDGLINLGTDSATSTATSPDTDHQLNEINHGEGRLKHKSEAEERSEEHTSELQSRFDLVCRLLLERKNQ